MSLNSLLTLILQSTLLLALAWAATRLARGASAATRHFIWAASLCLLLVLPLLPGYNWLRLRPLPENVQWNPLIPRTIVNVYADAPQGKRVNLDPQQALALLWATGAGFLLLRLLLSHGAAWRLRRQGRPSSFGWLLHDKLAVPLVVGVFDPVVILPTEALSWPEDRLDAVLAHEYAHVARHDTLWHLVSQLLCVFYWPHPLVWLAARHLHEESERAADNGVLASGMLPSSYAGHLVDLARQLQSSAPSGANPFFTNPDPTLGGVAMMRKFSITERVSNLLDPRINHSSLHRRTAVLTLLAIAGFGLAVKGVQLRAQEAGTSLRGVVVDDSGAPVSKAVVRLNFSMVQGSADRKEVAFTSDSGEFRFSPIPAGAFSLSVDKAGFASVQMSGLAVEQDKTTTVRLILPLGAKAESTAPIARSQDMRPASATSSGAPLRVGGNVQALKLINKVTPIYPADAKADRVEGVVLFQALIGADGAIVNLKPVNRLVDKRLAESAYTAVQQWRYQPTLLNGNPMEVITEIQVNFTLLP